MLTSRNLWLWVCIAAVLALASTHLPAQGPVKKAEPKFEELLQFDIRIQPEDPFDPRVEAGFKGSWKPRRGEVVRVEFHGKLKDGYNTYPVTQKTATQGAEQLSKIAFEKSKGLTPLWPLHETTPKTDYLLGNKDKPYFKYVHEFTWSQDVLIGEDAPTGVVTLPVKMDVQICSTGCVWFHPTIPVKIEVSDETPLPISSEISERVKLTLSKNAPPEKGGSVVKGGGVASEGLLRGSHEDYKATMESIAAKIESPGVAPGGAPKGQPNADLLSFVLAGIFWGAISLITPCVFPMIPITVSFFLKQSEKEHHRPIVMASVYSLTIVVVLTLAAAFLLSAFRLLSVHPVTNYIIGGLFIFFALSLFGMYEIELPHSFAQFTSAREGKGGLIGTIFMALTFTIISFACVAPFLGGFSGTAAEDRPFHHNLLGGLAFAATFASPFFLLALFPALLRKLPKSGSWLNSVKVVMGFLELAAAFKFFRTAELVQSQGVTSLFTFDFVLGLWIGMSVLCGLYLIGAFRLPHDTPEEHISVPRLLFSAAFIGLAFYLLPAMFKSGEGQAQRPGGAVYAWINSFLLPDTHADDTANLEYAIKLARAETERTSQPKRIFIDFTGVSCTNCKINEESVFTKPHISKLLSAYVMVKMYTDTVPLEYYASNARDASRAGLDAKSVNLPFQKKFFGGEQLPTYAILEPVENDKIRIVAQYDEGRIINEAAFIEFLENPGKK